MHRKVVYTHAHIFRDTSMALITNRSMKCKSNLLLNYAKHGAISNILFCFSLTLSLGSDYFHLLSLKIMLTQISVKLIYDGCSSSVITWRHKAGRGIKLIIVHITKLAPDDGVKRGLNFQVWFRVKGITSAAVAVEIRKLPSISNLGTKLAISVGETVNPLEWYFFFIDFKRRKSNVE